MRFQMLRFCSAAVVLAGTVLASEAAEAPTPASLHERKAPTSIAAQCWSGTAFPPAAAWTAYPEAFKVAKGAMQYGNDTESEIKSIHSSILKVAKKSGYDERFILSIIRRESDGETTIPCNDNGKSCGIMQVQGKHVPHCKHHPCPRKKILKMIECGVEGCGGSSISDCASRYGKHNWGAIARCYNSGSVPDPDDLTQTGGYGIRTYVMDIANLLLASDYATWSAFDNGECGYTNSS